MNPQRWQRLQQLFELAHPLDREARARLLDAECGEDTALKDEVLELLQTYDRTTQFEERIGGAIGETLNAPDLAVGQIIGRYRVIQLLGRGGMGSVYLAERADEQYRQRVALKIVARGLLHGELPMRFRAERQILARLNHPNIARLIDGGQMPDGAPFLVMEYIEGLRIDHYCEQNQLSTHARLGLIQQVCAAIDYAHQHLIIHRDLKPANILVTKDGVPKLLDFGIAKLLDTEEGADAGSPITQGRDRVLTPEHASPEQLRGEPVGTSSDVYSLGVLMYELLTGRHPYQFTNRSLYEIERVIREQSRISPSAGVQTGARAADSARARALARELAGDLDNIVLKAMNHQPQQRYGSAAALAQDIQNYIEGRPVLARPDTWTYRTRKFIRRNAFAVASGASVTLLIVTLVTVSTLRIAAERDAAERERQTATRVSQFMIDAFRLANPNELADKKVTAQEVLEAAAKNVSEELADEPGVRLAAMRTIGQTYNGMGLFEQARVLLLKTVEETRSEPRVSRLDLARALHLLGVTEFLMHRQEEAGRVFDEALEIRASLNQEKTDEGILLLTDNASARRLSRKIPEALQMLRRAEEFAEALSPPDPKARGNIYVEYGETYLEAGDFRKAEEYARRSLPLLKGVVYQGLDQYANSLNVLGYALVRQSRNAEAEVVINELRERAIQRYGPDHLQVGHIWNNYSLALTAQGKYKASEKALRESLRIEREHPDPEGASTCIRYSNLGEVLRLSGKPQQALEELNASLDLWSRLGRNPPAAVVTALLRKSATLRDLGELQAAGATLHDAETLAREKLEPGDPFQARILQERGALLLAHGDLDGARRFLQEAKGLLQQQQGSLDRVADTSVDLGEVALRSRQPELARTEFTEALAARSRIFPAGHWAIADARSHLGHALYLSGDRQRGLAMMSEAFKDLRATRPGGDPVTQAAERRLQEATNAAAVHTRR